MLFNMKSFDDPISWPEIYVIISVSAYVFEDTRRVSDYSPNCREYFTWGWNSRKLSNTTLRCWNDGTSLIRGWCFYTSRRMFSFTLALDYISPRRSGLRCLLQPGLDGGHDSENSHLDEDSL